MTAVAKYVFLRYTMPVVEKEGFTSVLPKLKLINHYDPQFTLSKCKIELF